MFMMIKLTGSLKNCLVLIPCIIINYYIIVLVLLYFKMNNYDGASNLYSNCSI